MSNNSFSLKKKPVLFRQFVPQEIYEENKNKNNNNNRQRNRYIKDNKTISDFEIDLMFEF